MLGSVPFSSYGSYLQHVKISWQSGKGAKRGDQNIRGHAIWKNLEVSWKFTISWFSTLKQAKNSKSFFAKAWKFSGLMDTYAERQNPSSYEVSTAISTNTSARIALKLRKRTLKSTCGFLKRD